ncbi:MAG: rhomboid family intramembrane serine protease, partial [Flavobacteriales bacterium]|nr:rhomboid family intramembrane serine protease [Flavobacteriales bacterium]
VHKNKSKVGGYTKADFDAFNHQKKIDVILDKISKSGYDSLTSEEKEFLFKAGK